MGIFMWKIFLKKNVKHLKQEELYLFIFNELENHTKLSEIQNHLNNCNECNLKYIYLKKNIEFLISNKDFFRKELFSYNNTLYSNLVASKIMGLFTKKGLAFFSIFSLLFITLFFINYFNYQKEYYSKEEDVGKLISLYKNFNLLENDLKGYDKLSFDFEDYFYEFENLFEIE